MTDLKQATVDGLPTWALAEERQHDLAYMVRCCFAELAAMEQGGPVAAPFYFERTAILLRKAKDYQREVEVCQMYIAAYEQFYDRPQVVGAYDVRLGPRYAAIVRRLAKARELWARHPPVPFDSTAP